MTKNSLKSIMIPTICVLVAIIIWLVLRGTNCDDCRNTVVFLQNKINTLQQIDGDIRSLSSDLTEKQNTIIKLQKELDEAQSRFDMEKSAALMQQMDAVISELKKIDDKIKIKLDSVGNVDGMEALHTVCDVIKDMINDNSRELSTRYTQLVVHNEELENAHDSITNLKLENAKLNRDLIYANTRIREMERYRTENDSLKILVANLKNDLAIAKNDVAIANGKITDLSKTVSRQTDIINAAKSSVPLAFEVNMRKFVSREDKTFKIPVTIKENVALQQSHEKKHCIIYLRVGKNPNVGGKTTYLLTNNFMTFNGKEKSYNGVYSFEWGGEELQFDIDVVSIEKKKIKLTQDNFVYDYYIFMDGQENSYKEDCFPTRDRNK